MPWSPCAIMRAHLRLWSKSELSDAAELGVTEF